MTKQFTYYKPSKILSYNAVFNFIVGGRGIGKTFSFKRYVIDKFLKSGDQFIYVRRYKTELRGRTEFFADVQHYYPNHDFRIFGNRAQVSPVGARDDKKRAWADMGFFIALSIAQNEKSVPYPNVKTILFDEFIIEKGNTQYISDEYDKFSNFFSTVDRAQDKTRVFFMANSVSIHNPYFLALKIRPDQLGEVGKSHGGFVAYHFPDSEQFKNEVYATRWGKFIKNTDYADFSIENVFEDGSVEMVNPKPEDARYDFTLELPSGIITAWRYDHSHYHIQQKRPKDEYLFTTIEAKMDSGKRLMMRNDPVLQIMRRTYSMGNMTFDSPETRNIFIEVFKR